MVMRRGPVILIGPVARDEAIAVTFAEPIVDGVKTAVVLPEEPVTPDFGVMTPPYADQVTLTCCKGAPRNETEKVKVAVWFSNMTDPGVVS